LSKATITFKLNGHNERMIAWYAPELPRMASTWENPRDESIEEL